MFCIFLLLLLVCRWLRKGLRRLKGGGVRKRESLREKRNKRKKEKKRKKKEKKKEKKERKEKNL